MDRRKFLLTTGLGSAAALLPAGCRKKNRAGARKGDRSPQEAKDTAQGGPDARTARPHAPTRRLEARRGWRSFPVIDAAGGPFEIGLTVGKATRSRIATLLERRKEWFSDLKAFALADRKSRLDGFAEAIQKHHPDIWAEMRGMAKGAGRPLDDIMLLTAKPEISALKGAASSSECSSLHLADGERLFLAHNLDDQDAALDLMVLVRARPKNGPAFVALAFPGIVAGNTPGMNEAGLYRATNYIWAKRAQVGIPRYVLGRALLGAKSIDQAKTIATHKAGAYSFHVNLGSNKEKRLVSLEVAPGGLHDLRETKQEVYVHTNHYILKKTKEISQHEPYLEDSSKSRYAVLTRLAGKLPPPAEVEPSHLIEMLSSHEAVTQPYSPCRHPKGDVTGRTVACALFDVKDERFVLYEGNPCKGRKRRVAL
jgi:predicted choloylglycine hydrolase